MSGCTGPIEARIRQIEGLLASPDPPNEGFGRQLAAIGGHNPGAYGVPGRVIGGMEPIGDDSDRAAGPVTPLPGLPGLGLQGFTGSGALTPFKPELVRPFGVGADTGNATAPLAVSLNALEGDALVREARRQAAAAYGLRHEKPVELPPGGGAGP